MLMLETNEVLMQVILTVEAPLLRCKGQWIMLYNFTPRSGVFVLEPKGGQAVCLTAEWDESFNLDT